MEAISDVKLWFDDIITDSQTNTVTDRFIDTRAVLNFSQQLPEALGLRVNFYSQF